MFRMYSAHKRHTHTRQANAADEGENDWNEVKSYKMTVCDSIHLYTIYET